MIEKVFFIEGIIGAGKTTQGKIICDTINNINNNINKPVKAVWIEEPVQNWIDVGILKEFYKDMKANAFKFQLYILTTRLNAIIEKIKTLDTNEKYILFIERSIFSDRHFFVKNLIDTNIFTDSEVKMYNETFDLYHDKLFPFPKEICNFIYFKPDITETLNRIEKRNRKDESVDYIYQDNLMRLHDMFFSEYCDTDIKNLKRGKNFYIITGNDYISEEIIKKFILV